MRMNKEHDQLIGRLLSDRNSIEVLKWLKANGKDEQRTVGPQKTASDSARFVKKIYTLGAEEIIAVNIRKVRGKSLFHTGKLVVKLPQDAKKRKAIFGWCKKQGDALGFSPDPDNGENHLFLLLD